MKLPSEREIAFTAIDESAGHDWDSLKYPPIYQEGFIDGAKWIKRLALKRTSEWVSVEDRLPEDGEEIFVFTGEGVAIDLYEDETFQYDNWAERMNIAGGNCRTVTHWMPLPPPPKGDE